MRSTRLIVLGQMAAVVMVAVLAVAVLASASPVKSPANTLAVCACGKVFVPDAGTPYLTVGDKQYACCSKACHDMAAKDAAASAKMAEQVTAQTLAQMSHMKMEVGNVIAITDKGTKALCGCGKEFFIDQSTTYIKQGSKAYACCTQACHDMAAKDPAAAVKSFEQQLAQMK